MGLIHTKAFSLTESDVRYVMSCTQSNKHAAMFLKINIETWKKYASMYIDKETGKTLYELHLNPPAAGVRRKSSWMNPRLSIEEVLAKGQISARGRKNLKRRLIRDGIKPERCSICSFDERRLTDYTVPLVLIYIDGDDQNIAQENLQLICFNCFYLNVGNLSSKNKSYRHGEFCGY